MSVYIPYSVLFTIVWIICGVIFYGFNFAYLQKEFYLIAKEEYNNDMKISILIAMFGPIALIVLWINNGYKHGFKWK